MHLAQRHSPVQTRLRNYEVQERSALRPLSPCCAALHPAGDLVGELHIGRQHLGFDQFRRYVFVQHNKVF